MEARTSHRGPPNKFLPFLKGPFCVHSRKGDYYTLRCLITEKLDTVHVSRLRHYISDNTLLNEEKMRKVAMWDYQKDYFVEGISAHEGEPTARKQLTFCVHWQGYGPERDSWIPYASLRDNDKLHRYILDGPGRTSTLWIKLIPEKFYAQYGLDRGGRRQRDPAVAVPAPV